MGLSDLVKPITIRPLMTKPEEKREITEYYIKIPEQYIKVELPIAVPTAPHVVTAPMVPITRAEEPIEVKLERLRKVLEPILKGVAVGAEKLGEALKNILKKAEEKEKISKEEVRKVLEEAGIPVITFEEEKREQTTKKLEKAL